MFLLFRFIQIGSHYMVAALTSCYQLACTDTGRLTRTQNNISPHTRSEGQNDSVNN